MPASAMGLSSNWKALQKKLATKPSSKSSIVKNKNQAQSANLSHDPIANKNAKAPSSKKAKNALKRKRIPPSDGNAMGAYISAPMTDSPPKDLTNQGLHPTHKPGKYLALDCEMVGTGPPPAETHVLARASVVNYHGEQIYDSYVLPEMDVTDYRTHVSGIRPEHLASGTARPFKVVREQVIELLTGRILVGHALKADLEVLMLASVVPRARIRDTSRYPAYRARARGKTPSLKKLALEVLGLEIQGGEHDSVVDARTAMELFKREKDGFERDSRKRFGVSNDLINNHDTNHDTSD